MDGTYLGVVDHREARVAHLAQALAHHVDVVDVEEVEFGARVDVLVLVTAAVGDVHHRIQLGPRVHDEDFVRLRVGVHHRLHVVLVGPGAVRGDAHQRLRTPETIEGTIRHCQHYKSYIGWLQKQTCTSVISRAVKFSYSRIPKRELPPTTSCHRGAGWAGDRAKSIPGVIVVLFHIFDYSLPSSQNINFY